jgi:hypothetical protein
MLLKFVRTDQESKEKERRGLVLIVLKGCDTLTTNKNAHAVVAVARRAFWNFTIKARSGSQLLELFFFIL